MKSTIMTQIRKTALAFLLPVFALSSLGTFAQDAANKNDPATWHDEGIYYYNKDQASNPMIMIDPSVAGEAKKGGFGHALATSYSGGLTQTKEKAAIAGAHSQTIISNKRPSFYFYFKADNLNPKLFSLCEFDVTKHERTLVVGSSNAFGGRSGISEKQIVEFTYERLSAGIFKVTPKADLEEGEYCFVYIGKVESTFANGYYDFGIGVK